MIYSINEGQQAEEYKARKAKEAEDRQKAENDRWNARYSGKDGERVGRKFGIKYNPNAKDIRKRNIEYLDNPSNQDVDDTKEYERTVKDDYNRYRAAWRASNNMVRTGKIPPFNPDERVIADTVNRHMRRHPNQYKESFLLTEEDADEFLESIGVTLYEDFVTIGEYSIPGVEAESILEEYGIFLYEEGVIIEGQQAEEYKKRKQLEDHEKFMKEYDRIQNRSDTGAKGKPDEDGDILFRSDNDNKRYSKTKEIVDRELNRRQYSKGQQDKNTLNLAYHRSEARDALNRHMRRHPDQYKESCGIFSNVYFI